MTLDEMVDSQIVARGVSDERVLKAMRAIPREVFVTAPYDEYPYSDNPLPIGYGQTISQPYIVAFMTELLELDGHEKVLEIGTGSGYQAAILSCLCRELYSLERIPELVEYAECRLEKLQCNNVHVFCRNGYDGLEEYGPYDAIIVTCAPDKIPEKLIEQLNYNGRMVIPVGSLFQELELIIKEGSNTIVKDVLPVRFVPMVKGR